MLDLNTVIKYTEPIKNWLIQHNFEYLLDHDWYLKNSWIVLNTSLILFILIFRADSNKLPHFKKESRIFESPRTVIYFMIKTILFLISFYFLVALKLNYKYS